MNNNSYQKPEFRKDGFHCSFCGIYANHDWKNLFLAERLDYGNEWKPISISSQCDHCKRYALWIPSEGGEWHMVYPRKMLSPLAHSDMPGLVKALYEEARSISDQSPRAAAALLRCALERLTEHLGEKDGSLYARIGNLAQKGLPKMVLKALDIVRITANEGGSHCGEIDLTGKDGKEVVDKLFLLVNFIVEKTITEPKEVTMMFLDLPESKKDGVRNRDNKHEKKIENE